MLRNRPRAMIGKQSMVADHHCSSQPSPARNHGRDRVSSFFASVLGALSPLTFCSDFTKPSITMMSSALIHDVSPLVSTNLRTRLPNRWKKRSWGDLDGLKVVDKLFDEMPDRNHNKPNPNPVIFGSSMRVRIEPVESPTDFGIKTRNSPTPSPDSQSRSRISTECLSLSKMELSEDYTRVTYHGPDGRTTHIFDNCVIESYCSILPGMLKPGPRSFLRFCYTCKESLEQSKDIYIYKGEKSFCGQECRHREIVLDGAYEIEEAFDVLKK